LYGRTHVEMHVADDVVNVADRDIPTSVVLYLCKWLGWTLSVCVSNCCFKQNHRTTWIYV